MKTIDSLTDFLKTFQIIAYSNGKWSVWSDFIFMSATAISNATDKTINYEKREKTYLRIINKYSRRDQLLFPKLLAKLTSAIDQNPDQDFLGTAYTRLELANRNLGQVFTPYDVCKLMAEITIDDPIASIEEKGYLSINDSACGAGATLIAAVNNLRKKLAKRNLNYQNYVLVAAQDIDPVVGLMCYIQLSLLGVAGYVKIGDSLSHPIDKDDDLGDYWFTPMYFSKVWTERRIRLCERGRMILT